MAQITAGEALLTRLGALGVDYVFANSGTDFPPLIEALARAQVQPADRLPQALIMPHEHAAMGMAHGYYLATGRPQAVIVHTNVGLANAAIGAINAASDNIPLLPFSGRTPITETGRLGSRTTPITWGQEMRDQAALIRESVKWDFELRYPEQVSDLVDRAYAIAMSPPRGPVYLSLPREPLCETIDQGEIKRPPRFAVSKSGLNEADVGRAGEILARAARPVILAQRGAGDAAGFEALADLSQRWALPVVQYWALRCAVGHDHPMHAGYDPAPWLADADAVIVLDSLTPWIPSSHNPPSDCPIIQIGHDPLFARAPVRGFRSDISLVGNVSDVVAALARAMDGHVGQQADLIDERRRRVAERIANNGGVGQAKKRVGVSTPMTKAWVGHCIADAVAADDAIVVSELGCSLATLRATRADSFYQEPVSGGLGWGFPTALGMQLAERKRLVIATLGDGSYIFSNPIACHQIAEALALPILIVILNNSAWNAVRRATLDVFPNGFAARANQMPLTSLTPTPDFVKVAEAHRCWARRVSDGDDLPAVLQAALTEIKNGRRAALIEAVVAAD